ncbi:MAG: rhombosortase [Pseudomonadota bacterium]
MRHAPTNPAPPRPYRGARLAVLLFFVAVATAAALGGDDARLLLRYDRPALFAGDWWRLATGHVVHLGWRHLLLNLAGLAVVWAMLGDRYRAVGWVFVTALSLSVMSGCFVFFEPQLRWYVGLSGLLHSWYVAGALAMLADDDRGDRRYALVLLALVTAKLIYEQLLGPLPATAETAGGPVVVNAHLYGAVGGALAAALTALWRRRGDSL